MRGGEGDTEISTRGGSNRRDLKVDEGHPREETEVTEAGSGNQLINYVPN